MCINPAEHEGKTFGCRKCWQCKENAIQDWVGRCIAQSKTSTHTFSTTVTYGGGDTERATVLTYSDVQKYFKRLRKAGFKFKYLVAGEYGSLKGRAHWHMILFFDGPAPKHALRKNFEDKFWPHGWSFWDEPNAKAIRYVCKYIRKDADDDEAQGHFMMSKKPTIGSEYFISLARRYAAAGIVPQDLKYRFPENRDKDGNPVQHMMHGATAKLFLQAYIDAWQEMYGDKEWPASQIVDEYCDSLSGYSTGPYMEERRYGRSPQWLPRKECKLQFSEGHNAFHTAVNGVRYWWWPLDTEDPKGEWAWHDVKGLAVIRWEQSDRYKELVTRSEQAKAERDASTSRRTSPANGETDYVRQRQALRPGKTLPMRGDPGWLRQPPRNDNNSTRHG